jgi:hypothetical protein
MLGETLMGIRVDQLTQPPIVGQFYDVPCIGVEQPAVSSLRRSCSRELLPWMSEDEFAWVESLRPVLLPYHADPEMGEPIGHFHIDLRFLSDLRLHDLTQFVKATLQRELSPPELLYFVDVMPILENPSAALTWVNLQCHRQMPEFPADTAQDPVSFAYLQSFVGQPLDCGRCPHRGVYVASGQRTQSNQVVCPGHGLLIDLDQAIVMGSTLKAYHPKPTRSFILLWLTVLRLNFEMTQIEFEFAVRLADLDDNLDLAFGEAVWSLDDEVGEDWEFLSIEELATQGFSALEIEETVSCEEALSEV